MIQSCMHHCIAWQNNINRRDNGYFLFITHNIIMLLTYELVVLEITKDNDAGIGLN